MCIADKNEDVADLQLRLCFGLCTSYYLDSMQAHPLIPQANQGSSGFLPNAQDRWNIQECWTSQLAKFRHSVFWLITAHHCLERHPQK